MIIIIDFLAMINIFMINILQYLCLGEERVHRTAYQKLLAETEENVDFPEEEKVETAASSDRRFGLEEKQSQN